jgi:hypothetical protein
MKTKLSLDKANQQVSDLVQKLCPDAPPHLFDLIDIVFDELKLLYQYKPKHCKHVTIGTVSSFKTVHGIDKICTHPSVQKTTSSFGQVCLECGNLIVRKEDKVICLRCGCDKAQVRKLGLSCNVYGRAYSKHMWK